ncbi:Homeobox domain [Carpediemonas membranifera]|uniref:Homeobox domain n=1 Tax=Carpediemonas membranifera TaxID=201153 RepID=A0A8J6BGM4_9EUKA|nr:Homeobox domain [Carpediemonas membranifera]|eukprot:KAG9397092.1 Homeobox domain [Carpediemonas membranifera]
MDTDEVLSSRQDEPHDHISLLPKISVDDTGHNIQPSIHHIQTKQDIQPGMPDIEGMLGMQKEEREEEPIEDEKDDDNWTEYAEPSRKSRRGRKSDFKPSAGVKKRSRGKAFSPIQYSILIRCQKLQQYPSREQIAAVANFARLEPARVKVWFQNARQRGVNLDADLMELPVDPADILGGVVSAMPEKPEPIAFAPHPFSHKDELPPPLIAQKREVAVQCDLIPERLLGMLARGELDYLLEEGERG